MSADERARKMALYEQFARVGKALANPARLELLDLLAQGPQVTRRIDGQSPAAAQIRQVGRVAQALVDQRDQMVTGVTHQSSTSNTSRSMILQYSKLYWKIELAKLPTAGA